jgi:uncharacterized integral membrane protein (TIGR00697 family)
MNEVLLIVEMLTMFTALVLAKKLFGKAGLFAWIAIASILANIQVVKGVALFGLEATLGNVLFASNFLATDILNECYGHKEAKKGVNIGLFAVIAYLVCSQLSLLFEPSAIDTAHGAMSSLFALAPRVCLASVIMFYLSNLLDVRLYSAIKARYGENRMWLRNNVCTIICNSLENFGFFLIAYVGVFPLKDIIIMGLCSSAIEVMIALCDTPFLYFAKHKVKN